MATTLQNVATQRRPAAMRFGGRRLNQVLRILAILTVLALSLFPLYWMLATAVTPGNELLRYPPRFLPTACRD